MILGIIGAENSHSKAIATIINVEKKIKGFSVDYLWGETAAFARDTAEAGQIPNIVKNPKQMLGKVDAVLVDHRHPKYHLPAVTPFAERGIPVFVDKPFCFEPKEGVAFLKLAKKAGAPITSFSVVPMQASFQKFKKGMESIGTVVAGSTYGPCDLESQWGGVFFYGIHQVEMTLMAFGYDVKSALITKNGNGSTGQLLYRDGKIVTMNLVKEGAPGFGISATGSEKSIHSSLPMDKSPYLAGVKTFCGMFKTRVEPISHDFLLRPVQVLDALARSKKSGRMEKVTA
ncbi:MAG TPA: Gfo/Idh/MocA family oxidoreductase [Candidatus Hydrogenedentes bacterium]|jgi:predicted dehydrogenase|nr:Gfo/Idh/MocA family oxidoreductase [Candidatus Hydrogenedentota bacterium]